MNRTSPPNDLRTPLLEDFLDRALSDLFKSQMKHPWPAAPATPTWTASSEPSGMLASRAAATHSPYETPSRFSQSDSTSSRDPVCKSRNTLAVSIMLLMGSCWLLSNSFQPADQHRDSVNSPAKAFGVFKESSAENPAALKELRKDKAEHGNAREAVPQLKLP